MAMFNSYVSLPEGIKISSQIIKSFHGETLRSDAGLDGLQLNPRRPYRIKEARKYHHLPIFGVYHWYTDVYGITVITDIGAKPIWLYVDCDVSVGYVLQFGKLKIQLNHVWCLPRSMVECVIPQLDSLGTRLTVGCLWLMKPKICYDCYDCYVIICISSEIVGRVATQDLYLLVATSEQLGISSHFKIASRSAPMKSVKNCSQFDHDRFTYLIIFSLPMHLHISSSNPERL